MQPRGMPLDPVVEIHGDTTCTTGVLEDRFNRYLDRWIAAGQPLRQRFGSRIVGGTGTGREDQNPHVMPLLDRSWPANATG